MRLFASLAILLLAAASVRAQERRPHVGLVRTADGEPLAGATVQFAWVPASGEAEVAADHPQATTDARGRFRADLLPCVHYRVWVTGPVTDGAYLASEVAWTAVGQSAELVAEHQQHTGLWTMTQLDGWRDRGPLRVRFLPDLVELPQLVVPIGEGGTLVGPVLPAASDRHCPLALELLAADGEALDASRATPTDPTQPNRTIAWTATRELPMRVVDKAGAPIAGATVRHRVTSGWSPGDSLRPAPSPRQVFRTIGTTAADGTLMARIACATDPFQNKDGRDLLFVASKPCHAATFSGFAEHPFVDGQTIEKVEGKELRFSLSTEQPLRIHLGIGDRSLVGTRVTVHANVPIHRPKRDGWTHESLVWQTTTDAAGNAVIADLPASTKAVTLHLGASAEVRSLMPEAQRGWLAATPVLLHRLQLGDRDARLDLATFRPLHLRIVDEAKAPASDVSILLMSEHGEARCDARTPQLTTDRAGRCAVLVQPGRWFVFARTELAMKQLEIDTGQLGGAIEHVLELAPMPKLFGRVVDEKGTPIAGAELDCDQMTWSVPTRNGLVAVAETLGWQWFRRVRTDAEGNFACGLVPVPGLRHLGIFRSEGRTSERFPFEPVTEPLTIVLH